MNRQDNKKTGILTFHRPNNYGAVLQAYALQQKIQEMGFPCEIIDYRNPMIENSFYNRSLLQKGKTLIKRILNPAYYHDRDVRNSLFQEFRDRYLLLSKQYLSCADFCKDFANIVVGSDQVWNLNITGNDTTYFLPYQNGARKLSYAASFGSSAVTDENVADVGLLKQFDVLLVREDEGLAFLHKNVSPNVKKVVDPTLLLRREQWVGLCQHIDQRPSRKYIVLYFVAPYTNAVRLAKYIGEKLGMDVIWMNPGRNAEDVEGIVKERKLGPIDFIHYIANAEYVITTSYHGLILSLNLNTKVFFELDHKRLINTNSRLRDIMNTYDISACEIKSDNPDLYLEENFNWSEINSKIENNRHISEQLLYSSLLEGGI